MQILGNLFNIIIFLAVVGSAFTVAVLFLQKVLRLALPLWAGVIGTLLYLIPLVVPGVKLISPETSFWMQGYQIASIVWVGGAAAFLLYYILRSLSAFRAVSQYTSCTDENIIAIYKSGAEKIELKQLPDLRFGTLKEPACVVTILRPVVILNYDIIHQLSESELQIILVHELTHIKRKHHLFQRIFDFVSILYWFNPLVWIGKNEFAYTCEMDCDNQALKALASQRTIKDYTTAMLRLLELSAVHGKSAYGRMSALGFLMVKQRFINILNRPTKAKQAVCLVVVILCVLITVAVSAAASRAMFYPYPAYDYAIHEQSSNSIE